MGWRSQPKDPQAALVKMFRKAFGFHGEMLGEEGQQVSLPEELLKPAPQFDRVLTALKGRNTYDSDAIADVTNALKVSRLSPADKSLALAFWDSRASHLGEPGAELLFLAAQAKPMPFANELVGDFYITKQPTLARAIQYYERELTVRQNVETVRQKILTAYYQKKDFASLAKLAKDSAYEKVLTPVISLEIAMHQHDWVAIWPPLLAMQKENFAHRTPVILSCVAGAVWLLLAWQMGQPKGLFSFIIWASLIAIPLGAASTLPVLFLDVYQSEAWGLKHTGLFFQDCLFFIAGVGLREELCKLLFFLPFLPFLLARKNRLEMIIIAGCVGLGFAVEENLSYFRQGDPSSAFARFLTANFFHFAATGIVGLSLCDTLRDLRGKWWKFPAAFVVVATAHGFYDAFISVPAYLFIALGLSCFIMLSLAFFREVARERGAATDQIFPAATLILGLAALIATILYCASREYGFNFALDALWGGALSLTIFVYMFYILFRDGLQEDEPIAAPVSDLH
jgi:RsiW-degrading membrane proteinase PrsW (M82 family)